MSFRRDPGPSFEEPSDDYDPRTDKGKKRGRRSSSKTQPANAGNQTAHPPTKRQRVNRYLFIISLERSLLLKGRKVVVSVADRELSNNGPATPNNQPSTPNSVNNMNNQQMNNNQMNPSNNVNNAGSMGDMMGMTMSLNDMDAINCFFDEPLV